MKESLIVLFHLIILLLCFGHNDYKLNRFKAFWSQTPPGDSAVIFAPGIISLDGRNEGNLAINFNGDLILFRVFDSSKEDPLQLILWENVEDKWTENGCLSFDSEFKEWDFNFHRTKNELYFTSDRSLYIHDTLSQNSNIWKTVKTDSSWSSAEPLDFPINITEGYSGYPSFANNGNMYFHSDREGGFGKTDLYRFNHDTKQVENLGDKINSNMNDLDPCVSPDESYLIFMSEKPSESFNDGDMYLSFNIGEKVWSKPIAIGHIVGYAGHPFISTDGKYLFFTKIINSQTDIYWIKTDFIQQLRDKVLMEVYCGQQNPREQPEIFNSIGINNSIYGAFCSVFSPDMNESILQE